MSGTAGPGIAAAAAGAGFSPPGSTGAPTRSKISARCCVPTPWPGSTTRSASCSTCTGPPRWNRPTCSSATPLTDRPPPVKLPAKPSQTSPAGAPFPLGAPLYESADGDRGHSLGGLLGSRPRYSVAKLAAYLAGPALYRDFRPQCPWAGIRAVRPAPPAPGPGGHPQAFGAAFRAAVAQAAGDHDCVAVAFSGGMDSAAVL